MEQDGSSETRGRRAVHRAVRWVALYGDRRLITLLLSALIFLSLLVVGTTWEFELETLLDETRAVQTLFNTLLGGIILSVSVVLSINVAALSREFTPLQVTHRESSAARGPAPLDAPAGWPRLRLRTPHQRRPLHPGRTRGSLADAESERLRNLAEILPFFASGREYYTTLYFKRELRSLSSNLLVLSLPVIVFTSYVLLAIDAGLFPTLAAFGVQPRLLYIGLAFVVALSPYVLLSSYMLRIVTVSKHSLESTSFTLDESGP